MQAAKNTQENFLRDVLGVMPMVQQTNAQPIHLGLEAFHQQPNRVGLTEQASSHQAGFVRHASSLRMLLEVIPRIG